MNYDEFLNMLKCMFHESVSNCVVQTELYLVKMNLVTRRTALIPLRDNVCEVAIVEGNMTQGQNLWMAADICS